MIVVYYRWRIRPDREQDFRAAWAEATDLLRAHGSGGSTLFRAPDGSLAALARWPDVETRRAAFAAVPPDVIGRMAGAVAEKLDEQVLTAVDIRWAPFPDAAGDA